MSLTIKAFLKKESSGDAEIRRFQIPADVSTSYTYLSNKLTEIFPALRNGNFSLSWKGKTLDLYFEIGCYMLLNQCVLIGRHFTFVKDRSIPTSSSYTTSQYYSISNKCQVFNARSARQKQDQQSASLNIVTVDLYLAILILTVATPQRSVRRGVWNTSV